MGGAESKFLSCNQLIPDERHLGVGRIPAANHPRSVQMGGAKSKFLSIQHTK
jgi:hypothetical protein